MWNGEKTWFPQLSINFVKKTNVNNLLIYLQNEKLEEVLQVSNWRIIKKHKSKLTKRTFYYNFDFKRDCDVISNYLFLCNNFRTMSCQDSEKNSQFSNCFCLLHQKTARSTQLKTCIFFRKKSRISSKCTILCGRIGLVSYLII